MPNTYRKITPKGTVSHYFDTPIVDFTITTTIYYNPYSNSNAGDITEFGINKIVSSKSPQKVFNDYTSLVTKAAKLIHIRDLFASNGWRKYMIEGFEKSGWKILRSSRLEDDLFSTQLYYDTENVKVDGLTIDKLVGKEDSKATKKVLESLEKEGPTNDFNDRELENIRADVGDGRGWDGMEINRIELEAALNQIRRPLAPQAPVRNGDRWFINGNNVAAVWRGVGEADMIVDPPVVAAAAPRPRVNPRNPGVGPIPDQNMGGWGNRGEPANLPDGWWALEVGGTGRNIRWRADLEHWEYVD